MTVDHGRAHGYGEYPLFPNTIVSTKMSMPEQFPMDKSISTTRSQKGEQCKVKSEIVVIPALANDVLEKPERQHNAKANSNAMPKDIVD